MTTLLQNITQAEYNQLAELYTQQVDKAPEGEYFWFFARIQKKIQRCLQKKFNKAGYKLVRLEENGRSGIRFKVVSKKDAFGFNVIDRAIVFKEITNDVCQHRLPGMKAFPDVKIVVPGYLDEKVNDITQAVFDKFMQMKRLL